MPKNADPGQLTTTEHNKRGLLEELEEMHAKKEAGIPCGGEACVNCGECSADMTKARLRKQRTLVTRLDARVLRLLEAATAT